MEETNKNIDDKNKLADIKLKNAQTKEISAKLKDLELMRVNEQQRINNDKINHLGTLLGSMVVDEEKTLPGGDLKWKPVFDDEETKHIKKKLMEILKRL